LIVFRFSTACGVEDWHAEHRIILVPLPNRIPVNIFTKPVRTNYSSLNAHTLLTERCIIVEFSELTTRLGGPNCEWIRQLDGSGNGRQGMICLCNHYDGPDKSRERINEAKAIIEKLHYKGEHYITFEKFVAKLTAA
jgi:hypothetical protein